MNDYPIDGICYNRELEAVESYHSRGRTIVFTNHCVFFFTNEKEETHFSKNPYWEFAIIKQESLVTCNMTENSFIKYPNPCFDTIRMPVVTINSLFKENDRLLCLVLHYKDTSYYNIAKLIDIINKVVE